MMQTDDNKNEAQSEARIISANTTSKNTENNTEDKKKNN